VDDEPEAPPDDVAPEDDEPLGDDEDDEPLGDDDEPEDDAPVDEPPEVELLPLGDADGLLLDEELLLICTPSFDAVSLSRRPVAFRPSFCW
jgi:hypothetical protein